MAYYAVVIEVGSQFCDDEQGDNYREVALIQSPVIINIWATGLRQHRKRLGHRYVLLYAYTCERVFISRRQLNIARLSFSTSQSQLANNFFA